MKTVNLENHSVLLWRAILLLALSVMSSRAQAPSGDFVSRLQIAGIVEDSGELRSGSGYFKFALVALETGDVRWTNDGFSGVDGEPRRAVELPLSEGRFSATLGATESGMIPINSDALRGGAVGVRVWYSVDGSGLFRLLESGVRLEPVAFSLVAGSVLEGSITEDDLANGAVTAAKLQAGLLPDAIEEATRQFASESLFVGPESRVLDPTSRAHIRGKLIVAEGLTPAESGGGRLELRSHGAGTRFYQFHVTDGDLAPEVLPGALLTKIGDDSSGWDLLTALTPQKFDIIPQLGARRMFVGAVSQDPDPSSRIHVRGKLIVAEGSEETDEFGGGRLELRSHGTGTRFFQFHVTDDDPRIPRSEQSSLLAKVGDDRGWRTLSVLNTSGYSVEPRISAQSGLWTFNAQEHPLTVHRGNSSHESLGFWMEDRGAHIVLENDENKGTMRFSIRATDTETGGGAEANTNTPLILRGNRTGSSVETPGTLIVGDRIRFSDGSEMTSATAGGGTAATSRWDERSGNLFYSDGFVGIGRNEPPAKLSIHSSEQDFNQARETQLLLTYGALDSGMAVVYNNVTPLGTGQGVLTVQRRTRQGNFQEVLLALDGGTGELTVNGEATVETLHITGGADVAEAFSSEKPDGLEPGMVATLDLESRHPSAVKPSETAYDKRVVGVVSGANGVSAGVVLTDKESLASGDIPIAMTGRVYVWCDAEESGPIYKGDDLVSSSVVGHAMKAVGDYSERSVVGIALETLTEGQGLVLTLIQ